MSPASTVAPRVAVGSSSPAATRSFYPLLIVRGPTKASDAEPDQRLIYCTGEHLPDLRSRLSDLAEGFADAANQTLANLGLTLYNFGTKDMSAANAVAQAVAPKAEPKNSEDYPPDQTSRRGLSIDDGRIGGSAYDWYDKHTKTSKSRKAVYADCRQMDSESPELHSAANVISRNLFSSEEGDEVTYKVEAEDKNVKRILDDLDHRTRLPRRAPVIAREHICMGDAFTEIVVGEERKPLIWAINELPPTTMLRNEDHGHLESFQQVDSAGNPVVTWDPWAIMHLRYNRPFTSKYGQSIFYPIRKDWRRISALEDSTVVMVLERASQVRVHKVPVPGDRSQQGSAMNDYKARNRRKRSWNANNSTLVATYNPMDTAEIYIPVPMGMENYPKDLGIDTLDGQANFREVITVDEYFQRKCLIPLGVPPSYMGIEKETHSRAINMAQEVEFGRMLRHIQYTLATDLKECVYKLQLRFAYGKDIPDEDYWLEFPRPSKIDDKVKAEIIEIQAKAAALIGNTFGVPLDLILIHFFGWGEEKAAEVAATPGISSQETEGLSKQEAKSLLGDVQRAVSEDSERARELGGLLESMADAADYLLETKDPVRV